MTEVIEWLMSQPTSVLVVIYAGLGALTGSFLWATEEWDDDGCVLFAILWPMIWFATIVTIIVFLVFKGPPWLIRTTCKYFNVAFSGAVVRYYKWKYKGVN